MNKNNNQTEINNILSSLSSEYIADLYEPNYKTLLWNDLSNKSKLIENTINTYKKHHNEFEEKRIQPIFNELLKIIEYDEVIGNRGENDNSLSPL